jgi:hypothetical protein
LNSTVHAQLVHGMGTLQGNGIPFLCRSSEFYIMLSSVKKGQGNFCYVVTPFRGFRISLAHTSRAGAQASQHCMLLGFLQTFTPAVIPVAELTNLQRRE